MIIVNGQLQVSDLAFSGTPGASFALDDLLDSPDIVALAREQGIEGLALTLNLECDEAGRLRALVIGGDQQVVIDPIATD